jgi:hypothetical protein
MKYLKTYGLAAVVALAFAAIGAGSASATVLCKTNPCTEKYFAGTKVSMQLPTGFDMRWTANEGLGSGTCSFSTLTGETSNFGGVGARVSVPLSKVSWTTCGSSTWETLKTGVLEIKYANEGLRNEVFLKGTEWRVEPAACTYSAGAETKVGSLTPSLEGSAAEMHIEATFAKVAGSPFCSHTEIWEGNYEVTAPKPLYFSES